MPPCIQGLGVLAPRHSDARPECGNRLCSILQLRSWMWFTPRLVLFWSWAMLCESRPRFCGHFHEIAIVQAVQWSDLCFWQCRDSLPLYLEEDLILESQANPMPMQWLCTTPTFNMETKWENVTWNKENTWGTRTSWGIAVIFMWHPPLGGHEQVFRPFEAQKLCWVIIGPRRIFFSTACIGFVLGTPWCHCICTWSRLRTIFF